MNKITNQNKAEILKLLDMLRTNSILRVATALETPQGIKYQNYVARVQNYTKGDKNILARIDDALQTIILAQAGQEQTPEKIKNSNLLLNTILGRSAELDLSDEELSGISGAIQVLDIK